MLQSDHIGVTELFHDLKLAILVPLVLIDLLYGHHFAGLRPGSLKNDAKRAISDDSVSVVGRISLKKHNKS